MAEGNRTLRFAVPDDAAALLEIYRQYIDTPVTFERELPSVEEFRRRIVDFGGVYPYLVAEEAGRAVGYVYGHRFAERWAYQWGAELSVYLDREHRGRGLGRQLYRALMELLRLQGVRTVYGCVTLPNPRSEAMHEALGFQRAARFHNAGFRLGQWRDVAWFEKQIADYDDPRPLVGIREVDPARAAAVLAGALEG